MFLSNDKHKKERTPPLGVFTNGIHESIPYIYASKSSLIGAVRSYPFGLVMSGISSKTASNVLENKSKFNGIEQNNDFDLNMYDAHFRNLDPQTGKFWQIDPKLESVEMLSPYAAMSNNPILYSDPLGDIVRNAHDEEVNLATQRRDAANAALNTSMGNYGVVDRNISRKDFLAAGRHTKDEWNDFKSARKGADKAESRLTTAVSNQFDAQEDINQLQHDNPTLFNAVNNLPVDVFIGRTNDASIVDNGGGANAINAEGGNVQGRMYNLDDLVAGNAPVWRAGIAIWTNGRGQDGTVRHEVGHTASMYGGVPAIGIVGIPYGGAGNPANVADYIRNFAAGGNCADCRDNRNNCTPSQAAAVAAEQLRLEAANRYIRRVNPNR